MAKHVQNTGSDDGLVFAKCC